MPEVIAHLSPLVVSPLAVTAVAPLPALALFLCSALTLYRGYGRADRVIALLLFFAAFAALLPNLNHAAELRTSPDSVEYALGAKALVEGGSYSFLLGGQPQPPRYPIGFPLFVLAPAVILLGTGSLAHGVWGVAAAAAFGVAATYLTGLRLMGRSGGCVAAALVLAIPGYVGGAQEILTTAPAAGFVAAAIWLSLSGPEKSAPRWLGSGISLMLATACRPLSAVFCLPLVVAWRAQRERSAWHLALLLMPTVAWVEAMGWYNAVVFGNPLRSGYHVWCPVPYDYPAILFGAGYIAENLSALSHSMLAILLPLSIVGLISEGRRRGWRGGNARVLLATLGAALLVTIFHLLYFFAWDLYFVPCSVALAPLGAIGLLSVLQGAWPRAVRAAAALALPAGLAWGGVIANRAEFREVAVFEHLSVLAGVVEELQRSGSVRVITARNPAHVEFFVGAPVLPISRRVEYASKLIAPVRVPARDLSGVGPTDHRAQLLKDGGAQEVYATTALESLDALGREVQEGTTVLVDTESLAPEEAGQLKARFSLEALATGVHKLSPLAAPPS